MQKPTLPRQCKKALGWRPDPVIDSGKRNYSSSLPVSILEANRFAAASVTETMEYFSGAALKYWRQHKKVPVLIIDDVERFTQN